MLAIKWITTHQAELKNTFKAIFSEETKEDIGKANELFGEFLEVIFDIIREPLHELSDGKIDLPKSRAIVSEDMKSEVLKRLKKLDNIVEYHA